MDTRNPRTTPLPSQTSTANLQAPNINANGRFSFVAEVPIHLQGQNSGYSSPTHTVIDESPTSPTIQNPMEQTQNPSERSYEPLQSQGHDEKMHPERLGSPYHLDPPQQPHPALFAPYAEPEPSPYQHQSYHYHHHPPQESYYPPRSAATKPRSAPALHVPISPPKQYHDTDYKPLSPTYPDPSNIPPLSPTTPRTPTYNPHSLTGPNVNDPGSHKPGQVAHPNATVRPHWHYSLYGPSSTCCFSLVCPCILYGRTQHRLGQKAQKRDATDMLGHNSATNSACALMTVAACFGGMLAMIQRSRVRRLYEIEGSVGDDCLMGCCCCCCVLAQDEREVRVREEKMRRFAGPASASIGLGGYETAQGMSYPGPPR